MKNPITLIFVMENLELGVQIYEEYMYLLLERVSHGLERYLLCVAIVKLELGSGNERTSHQTRVDGEARRVVALVRAGLATRMIGERLGVIEQYAHTEHGHRPSQTAKHALTAVEVGPLWAQILQGALIGQCDRRRAKKLASQNEEEEDEKNAMHVPPVVHNARLQRRLHILVHRVVQQDNSVLGAPGAALEHVLAKVLLLLGVSRHCQVVVVALG